MRIAIFVGAFPVISETFILRQIVGLIDLGHEVNIFAECGPPNDSPIHREVQAYNLATRTTYVNMPLATCTDMPVWPIYGKTWTAESETPLWNAHRILKALPVIATCLMRAPVVACKALQRSHFSYQAASLSSMYRLAALCRKHWKFDVLHAHFGPVGNNFRLARDLFRAPLIVSFHGYDFTRWPCQEGADCYERLWNVVDCVTVNSNFTATRVRALGCPARIMHTLPVGLNANEFVFRERRLGRDETVRVLSVGRLVEKKGHEYALRGIALARHHTPNIHYTIVGDGPLRGRLEFLVQELGLADHVSILGAKDSVEVRRLMSDAHVFMLTSVRARDGDEEGQGLVVQEAQACGLPVIATRHGPLPEGMLDGHSGYLVDEADAGAIAGRLVQLVRQPELWAAMGRRGRAFVEENFDIRRLNRRLVEIYTEVAETYRAHG